MADVTDNKATRSDRNMEDSKREERETNRQNREEDGDTEYKRSFDRGVIRDGDDRYQSEQHFTEWRGAMERGVSPFEYMNKIMERIEGMDENDLRNLYRDREEMRKQWQEARDEGRVDEFWNKWAEDRGSQPHFNYGYGPPLEVMQKWIRLQQEGKSRREIFREMVGERIRDTERFGEHGRDEEIWRAGDGDEIWGGQGEREWSGGDEDRWRGRGREFGGRADGRRRGRGEGGRECGGGEGVRTVGEGERGGRGEGAWSDRGEGGWRGRDEGRRRGRGERGWRGRGEGGWRGRGWNVLKYGVDPDKSYLFEQFNF